MHYIPRSLEAILQKARKQFPAIVLTGPRQAGKTTLLKHLFGETHRYVSLEPPDVRLAAASDPRGFLALNPPPVLFDEIQYAPQLFPYLKEEIDANRQRYGEYILTGSQNLLLLQQVTESLAGRAAILKLLPLSSIEKGGTPLQPLFWRRGEKSVNPPRKPFADFWEEMLRGDYPELTEHREKDPLLWHSSYVQTYLERDVRTLRQVGDLTQFQLFLRAIAARSGQLFQLSDVARDIGLSVNTVKAWLAILEATYQIVILRPYFANLNKRLVKAPKIYFTDVGMLCYFLGVRQAETLFSGPLAGPVVETYVVSELYKRMLHAGEEPGLHFWRTASGSEVDLIAEWEGRLVPIEVKASATARPEMAAGIAALREDLKGRVGRGYVVYLGEQLLPLAPDILALPFPEL